MKDSLILEGKIYISAKRAAKIINYAQDYIGQLCRSGKLDCKMIGRSWYVTEESLLSHREQAVDATQERVLKVVKSITPVVAEKKIEIPSPAPIISPVSSFKYEAEIKSPLPEITKKLPVHFSLSKKVTDLTSTPFAVKFSEKNSRPTQTVALSLALPRTLTVTAAIALVLMSSFLFLLAGRNTKNISRNDAHTASLASEFLTSFMRALGFGRTPSPLATIPKTPDRRVNATVGTTTDFNGIGVVPSTGYPGEDEIAKAKILNSFSDEVTIHPDQSGTAGVIKPVFKESSGDDFVYVLVPIKEEKKP